MPAVKRMNVEDEYLMNFYAVAAESRINKLTAYKKKYMPQRKRNKKYLQKSKNLTKF